MEKIIHQIWVGSWAMPSRIAEAMAATKAQHTDFTHILWNDTNIPKMPSDAARIYKELYELEDFAFAADVLRQIVVHQFGGVYVDADFVPVRGLGELNLDRYPMFLARHDGVVDTVSNGIFGIAHGHPLSKFLVDAIGTQGRWCGPSWMGGEVKRFLGAPNDITHDAMQICLNEQGALVVDFDVIHTEYMRHEALHSWFPEDKVEMKRRHLCQI